MKNLQRGGMRKVHPDRPRLQPGMDPSALHNFYWYLQELVAYCRAAGLSTTGQKHELLERVQRHLENKLPLDAAARQPRLRAAAVRRESIALDDEIGPDYKCDERTRVFFKSIIGEHFHFTAHLQRFRRENAHRKLTYRDLAEEWKAEYERRKDKNYKSTLLRTWEYNNFVRDFLADKERNAGKTMKDAAAAWNRVRQSKGARTYASTLSGKNKGAAR